MTDALVSDQLLGEDVLPRYAFVSCNKGKEDDVTKAWKAKGINALTYVKSDSSHQELHSTLRKWSEIYRDGFLGRKQIINLEARKNPRKDSDDDFVKRVLWALVDRNGAASETFANLEPPPPLEWFTLFNQRLLTNKDLPRLGYGQYLVRDEISFSLFERPYPLNFAPRMSIFEESSSWDPLMKNLVDWLLKYFTSPELLLNFAKEWRPPSPLFREKIIQRLNESELIKQADNPQKRKMPEKLARKMWDLWLSGNLRQPRSEFLDFKNLASKRAIKKIQILIREALKGV